MNKDFYDAIKDRRTYYSIDKNVDITKEKIQEVVEHAIKYSPSAFNSQSANVVLLFEDNHQMLWDIVKENLRKIIPEDKFSETESKINSFANGYGTLLFFENTEIVKDLQEQYPLYKDNFPVWASQSNGMLQLAIWTSLEIEGLGVSLQHYNPLIDNDVKEKWNIPASWQLVGQMPFGKPTKDPDAKEFRPIEDRLKIF